MAITLHEGLNQSKPHRVFLEIDLVQSRFLRSSSKYLKTRRRQWHARKGEALKIRPRNHGIKDI
jgi:hypothetical protein